MNRPPLIPSELMSPPPCHPRSTILLMLCLWARGIELLCNLIRIIKWNAKELICTLLILEL